MVSFSGYSERTMRQLHRRYTVYAVPDGLQARFVYRMCLSLAIVGLGNQNEKHSEPFVVGTSDHSVARYMVKHDSGPVQA